jgi:hypothetical protein
MLCGEGEFWDKIHAVSFWAASTTSLHNYSHLVLVELDLVVVFRVVVLVDIVAGYVSIELYTKEKLGKTYSGSKLSDWSQTRLAGMDLANSSIDWNSSSERSTAKGQHSSGNME